MTGSKMITGEPEDENEEEVHSGAPPGVAYVGECAAHPGDGTAWIGSIIVNPDW